jgi:hypothetical protein
MVKPMMLMKLLLLKTKFYLCLGVQIIVLLYKVVQQYLNFKISKETRALWVVHSDSRMIVNVNYQTHAHKVIDTNSKTRI